jgi:alanine dehydrogenase
VVSGNAAQIALALGAEVVALDSSAEALARLETKVRSPRLVTGLADGARLARELPLADAVIGGVLKLGARAPRLITRPMLSTMKAGSVIVDVSIDQGGCAETSRPTTHDDPTYVVDGVVHYCVTNMPGAVPRTSTYALNHATLPYVRALASRGVRAALESDPALLAGLNVAHGRVTRREVAEAHGLPWTEPREALSLIGQPLP